MIIELFGAPGCGKTTFVHVLAERLRGNGHRVEMLASLRPNEGDTCRGAPASSLAAATTRLIRPIGRLASDVRQTALNGTELGATWRLLRAMPPHGPLWSMRLYRYTLHLNCAWSAARRASHPVLVDQGYVQLLGSLVVLSGTTDMFRITNMLRTMPAPDLLIRLKTPDETLRYRLARRMAGQGWLERRLEFSIEDNLRFAAVLDSICPLLRQAGREAMNVCSIDTSAPARVAALIEERLALRQGRGARGLKPEACPPQSQGVA